MSDSKPTGTYGSYSLGFGLSVLLTVAAYVLVTHHVLAGWQLIGAVTLLAALQLLTQLWFFLHLGRGSKSKWNLVIFLFMLMVVGILVLGSLWIMYNLNYGHTHSMSPNSIVKDEGF